MGKAISITRSEHSSAELRTLASQCDDGAQVRRLLSLALVLEADRGARQRLCMAWTVRPCTTGCCATTPKGWRG